MYKLTLCAKVEKKKIFDISLQTSVFNAEFTGFQKEG